MPVLGPVPGTVPGVVPVAVAEVEAGLVPVSVSGLGPVLGLEAGAVAEAGSTDLTLVVGRLYPGGCGNPVLSGIGPVLDRYWIGIERYWPVLDRYWPVLGSSLVPKC